MRVIVVSNCATRAYATAIQAAFPGWDVRGALHDQADEWVAQEHTGFLGFLAQADIALGLTSAGRAWEARLTPAARRIEVPYFVWSGLQPDTVWLHGIPSPLKVGVIHSRLITAVWLSGADAAATRTLFNADHMEKIGFMAAHKVERERLVAEFAEAGIAIGPLFDTWRAMGNFMHTPNHPRICVFFDIALAAMAAHGFTPIADADTIATARAAAKDYLAEGIIWPLYPEIALHHGLSARPPLWREPIKTSETDGLFDLDEMIARSRRLLDCHQEQRDRILQMMGGRAEVARLTGL